MENPALESPTKKNESREKKWEAMLSNWTEWQKGAKLKKLKNRCRKGIPPSVRGRAWLYLSGANQHLLANPDLFERMSQQEGDETVEGTISRDIHRTFPEYEQFQDAEGDGQKSLSKVLRAYAIINPVVGYCQGMAFIVGILLMHMAEEEAFWTLFSLLEGPQYLRGYYRKRLSQEQLDVETFRQLLHAKNRKVANAIDEGGIHPSMYTLKWFMTLFTTSLTMDTVLRIWDAYFFEGVKVIYRVGVALMTRCQPVILQLSDPCELLPMLQNVPEHLCKADDLFKSAFGMGLKRKEIKEHYSSAQKTLAVN